MNCPKDGTAMRERERDSGEREVVVMDICPNCGGIWLDKGEIEKLTVAEERYYDSGRSRRANGDDDDDDDDDDRDRRESGHEQQGGHGQGGYGQQTGSGQQRRRRGGFLGNILENFGG